MEQYDLDRERGAAFRGDREYNFSPSRDVDGNKQRSPVVLYPNVKTNRSPKSWQKPLSIMRAEDVERDK